LVLVAPDGRRLKCHRVVLAVRLIDSAVVALLRGEVSQLRDFSATVMKKQYVT